MDYFIFQQINNLAGKFVYLDTLATFLAEYFQYILAALVFFIFWRKWQIIFQSFLAAIIARFGIVELIRLLWERPRPFVENEVSLLLEHTNNSSFPSGHAAFFFALSTVIYFYNKKAGRLFFIASFLISISRVFTGIHWPSDILAGGLIGVLTALLIRFVFHRG